MADAERIYCKGNNVSNFTWTDEDRRAVDTARVLAADAVQKVGNGHPGTAISLAPLKPRRLLRAWQKRA